ncbi:uncharacterized protein At2g33490-like [Punica granatum]|uniref:Uncharacterized protein At2g33490-like n=2 Tax=Punica granatum TaxID=22663 RepID=A0A6P8CJH9_PUNGR|nr:uncharacterized protein At2g33490-like [Punica granatum]PKI60305.1 hypothetical protein CRG98_019241 [Punica granatum]
MKSSLGKFRRFAALHRSDTKEKLEVFPSAQLDELALASKDMQAMKNCYDSLLSAAAATANSAYEFSESLQEMGTCLLEKTALQGDGESGNLLSMLGKVQLELQKLVDSYRSHIILTITNPSESFLNELRNVEEMKKQCDEKRDAYEYMITQQREKGKSKSGKGESFVVQQLQSAHEEYEEEANLCVFRLKSLKQGQSRSLLTQAARHHMAQLNFFRKGLRSLEAVDSHVKRVAELQHIDYHVNVLEDEVEDGEDGYNDKEDGELSFDYRRSTLGMDVSTSGNSMEVDDVSWSHPAQNSEVNLERNQGDFHVPNREHHRMNSYSAPIFVEKKFDPAEKVRQMQHLSASKPNSYVLPTPSEGKGGTAPRSKPTGLGGSDHNLSHSSPLEQRKQDSKPVPELKDGKYNGFSQLPPPLPEGFMSDIEKFKRQAFSGPLTSKPVSKKPVLSASGPISSSELPHLVSGMLSRSAQPSSSPKVSPSASPPLVSSPRINELHKLPRPPGNKPAKSSGVAGHSAPLVYRNQEFSPTNKIPSTASPLPAPPLTVPRSFSIPSSSQRAMAFNVGKILEPPRVSSTAEKVSSPPLTSISLANMKPVTSTTHSGPIRGGG